MNDINQKTEQLTLLVVDDEPILRNTISINLKRKGFRVLTAENGAAALDLVKKEKINLVISDIRMPGGNGIELLDNIRDAHYENPVLFFMTGYSDMSLEEAYDRGADAVFAKPFSMSALSEAVEKALTPRATRWEQKSEPKDFDIRIELKFPKFCMAVNAKALNIGRGGMFVSLKEKFPEVGSPVEFRIEFAQGGSISSIDGNGLVRWVRANASKPDMQTGCGIEFIHLTESCRQQILELISAIKTRAYIPVK